MVLANVLLELEEHCKRHDVEEVEGVVASQGHLQCIHNSENLRAMVSDDVIVEQETEREILFLEWN